MVEKIVFDKDGNKVLPVVVIGHERLLTATSHVAGAGFVVCREHGTVKSCYVRRSNPVVLCRCCRLCVVQYCQLAPAKSSKTTSDDTNNPVGHSY